MKTLDENIGSTLSSIFKRKGGDGKITYLYTSADAKTKAFFDAKICGHEETPVLVSKKDEQNWLILTEKNLYMSDDNGFRRVSNADIKEVRVDLTKMRIARISMLDQEELILTIEDNSEFCVRVESGLPFSGLFSVLKNLETRHNAKARP